MSRLDRVALQERFLRDALAGLDQAAVRHMLQAIEARAVELDKPWLGEDRPVFGWVWHRAILEELFTFVQTGDQSAALYEALSAMWDTFQGSYDDEAIEAVLDRARSVLAKVDN